MEQFEIRATGYELNMASWCCEKAARAMEYAARAIDHLRSTQGLPGELVEKLLMELRYVVSYQLTLLAFAAGTQRSPEDTELVLKHGFEGYEQVARKYGVILETTRKRRANELLEFSEAVERLLSGGPYPSRTQLHELLRIHRQTSQPLVAPLVDRLEDLLEQVTQGDLSWEQFVPRAREELAKQKQEANTDP